MDARIAPFQKLPDAHRLKVEYRLGINASLVGKYAVGRHRFFVQIRESPLGHIDPAGSRDHPVEVVVDERKHCKTLFLRYLSFQMLLLQAGQSMQGRVGQKAVVVGPVIGRTHLKIVGKRLVIGNAVAVGVGTAQKHRVAVTEQRVEGRLPPTQRIGRDTYCIVA